MATKKEIQAKKKYIGKCARCGEDRLVGNTRPMAPGWSKSGYSPYCINCENEYYERLAELNGTTFGLFAACMAFNVPFVLAAVPVDTEAGDGDRAKGKFWQAYIQNLIQTKNFEKNGEPRTFFSGETRLNRIFGDELSGKELSGLIEKERAEGGCVEGEPEQRERWGMAYTAEQYDELDRLYYNRLNSFRGQTITPQMEDTIMKVAEWSMIQADLVKAEKYKEAKDMQAMIDNILASESMRKKDEKPMEHFRPDAWITAFESSGLMKDGDFVGLPIMIRAMRDRTVRSKKYDYSLDVADQILLNWENNRRQNEDLQKVYELPDRMKLHDAYGEFEPFETKEEKRRKRYANLPKVSFAPRPGSAEQAVPEEAVDDKAETVAETGPVVEADGTEQAAQDFDFFGEADE